MTTQDKARHFIYRNARPLDLARWQFHFEQGTPDAVLSALAAYQNEDGGFGHALEADTWNPNSAPIQVWAATEILREIGWADSAHPLVVGILRFLGSGQDFDGHFWRNAVRTNNDYPHAPWWSVADDAAPERNYNPTACLAGFILRFAGKDTEIYGLGQQVAQEAIDAFLAQERTNDMHATQCYIRLLEYAEHSGENGGLNLAALRQRLLLEVRSSITRDTSVWETAYICKPSLFFNSRESVFYADNRDIAQYECDTIERTQKHDGAWAVTWAWGDYPQEWAITENWWKSQIAISNMLFLKGMGRL